MGMISTAAVVAAPAPEPPALTFGTRAPLICYLSFPASWRRSGTRNSEEARASPSGGACARDAPAEAALALRT